jgi:hypothetical protein
MKRTIALLMVTLLWNVAAATEPVTDSKVYVDGRTFFAVNGLDLSAKGQLMVGRIDPVTGEKQTRKFMIVIKRTFLTGNFSMVSDIRYNDGEVFETIDINKVLAKAEIGDEILVIPVDDEKGKAAKITGCIGPMKIKVRQDQC